MSTGLSIPFFPAPVVQTDGFTNSAASQIGAGATTDSSLPLWNPLDPCDLDFLSVGDSFTQEIVALSESFLDEGAGSAAGSSSSGRSFEDASPEGHDDDDDDADMVDTIQQLLDLTSDQHLVEELLGGVTDSEDDQIEVKIDPILEEDKGLDGITVSSPHVEMKTEVPVELDSSPAVGQREETADGAIHSLLIRNGQTDAVHAIPAPCVDGAGHAIRRIMPTPQPCSINTTEPLRRIKVMVKPTPTTGTLSPDKKTTKRKTVLPASGVKAVTARPPLVRRLILPKSSRPVRQQHSKRKHNRIVLVLSPKQLQQVRVGHTKIVLASRTARKDPLAGVPPDQKPPPAASCCVFDNRDCSDWMIPLDALLEEDDAVLPTAAAHQLYAQPADIPDDLQDLVLDNVVSAETAALPYDSANTLLEELMVSDQLQLSSFPDDAGLDHMTEQLFPSHQLSQSPHASPVPQLLSLSEMMSGTPSPPPLSSPQQSALFTGYPTISTPPSPICHDTMLPPSIPNEVARLDDSWNESVRRECEALLKTPTTVAPSVGKQQKQQRRRAVDPYSRPSTTAVTSDLQQTAMTSSAGDGAKMTDAQRREKKRLQNKLAATRYREKKRMELSEVALDEDVLEQRNSDLKERVHTLTRELDYLRQLMRQVLQHKQVI